MPHYRVTFRYGGARALYEVMDIEADDLREAMRSAADDVSEEVSSTAELVEVRVQADPDDRAYVEE